jgi:DNA-binding NarL/FixJ family response regulator
MISPDSMVTDVCIDDSGVSLARVLVVEDHEPFRRFICSTLGTRQDLQIVGEASDGLEAVRKTDRLRPSMVVLDIGLPGLNGFEAARRILALVPECKIIFLSQENSIEVVQAAFSLGAHGYVVKMNAGSELLPAVKAVREGRQFASSTLPQQPRTASHRHEVQFYPDDPSFLAGFTLFIEDALKAGNAAIVIVTGPHHKELLKRLQARGIDCVAAMEEGSLTVVDAAETLATFMVNDLPDPVRFFKAAGDLVAEVVKRAKGKPSRVVACGALAPTLWAQGNADAAIQLELLWDEAVRMYSLDTLCGYVLTSTQRDQESDTYQRICEAHSAVCSL